MRTQRSLTGNAADPVQVRYAARKEKQAAALFADALETVLRTPAGRIVLAGLLTRAGLDRTSFDLSGPVMSFQEGRRNFGLELKAEIIGASEDLYELMEREARARQRSDEREAAAFQIPAAEEVDRHA